MNALSKTDANIADVVSGYVGGLSSKEHELIKQYRRMSIRHIHNLTVSLRLDLMKAESAETRSVTDAKSFFLIAVGLLTVAVFGGYVVDLSIPFNRAAFYIALGACAFSLCFVLYFATEALIHGRRVTKLRRSLDLIKHHMVL